LPLDYISQFLKGIAADAEVDFSDDLCHGKFGNSIRQQIGDSRPLVLGACTKLKLNSYLRGGSSSVSDFFNPAYVVDLLSSSKTASNSRVIVERLKLLLLAKIKRINAFSGIRQDNLKVHFSLPHAEVTRRQFLTTALPKYELVPCIESCKCRGEDKCGLCVNICHKSAISTDGNDVLIDVNKCDGCGACVTFCPFGAIYYPTFSLEELDSELEGLLLCNNVDLEPRIIAFVCDTCLSTVIDNDDNCITYPYNILPIYIPCLAMVSPWLILRAFDMGGQGVVLVSGKDNCRCGFESTNWGNNVEFAKALLRNWRIQTERIEIFQTSRDNLSELRNSLACFTEKVSGLMLTPFKSSNPTIISEKGLRESELIRGMDYKTQYPSTGAITTDHVPFGKLKLDNSHCTGCGLCAVNCPTDALTIGHGNGYGDFELLFQQNLCIGCGKCVIMCPEKCLQLQRILELDRIHAGAYQLFTDDMFACRNCGENVAPISMIIRLKAKLQNMDSVLIEQIEFCTRCKMENHSDHLTN
jgi:ferredoxin